MGVLGKILGGINIGDIFAGVLGGINTGYNIWSNKRDFDYQKALQQQMFEREDTAVQRRAADLEAAGLNPALAGGSAASAGPVVSRSNTNDVDFGSALDMVAAVNQIRQQKQETENKKVEHNILESENQIKDMQKDITLANTLMQLGIPFKSHVFDDGNMLSFDLYTNPNNAGKYFDTNIQKQFDYQIQNLKNSADLLQKDVDFYTVDKLFNYARPFIPSLRFR